MREQIEYNRLLNNVVDILTRHIKDAIKKQLVEDKLESIKQLENIKRSVK